MRDNIASAAALPSSVPLYKELVGSLREALQRGEWKPGEAIPAERRLAERFGVSIGTLRKAIDALVADHILIRRQGRGTFVASHGRERSLFYFFHVVPDRGPKLYPEVRLLAFSRARTDREQAEALGLRPGAAVFRIRNLLLLEGASVIVDDIALPASRFAGLSERRFRERPSTIYNLYEDAFGISVLRTSERLRAVPAGSEEAQLLRVRRGSPLLRIRRVALSYRDEPVEYRVSLVNTLRHEYYADIGT